MGARAFVVAFLGFFLLGAAWSAAMPYDGSPDELRHVVRAYGVLDGQIASRADAHITVPQSLVPTGAGDSDDASCMRWKLDVTAACTGKPAAGDESRMVVTSSGAANYNPLYYAVIGWPIKLFPDYGGVVAARLVTCLLTSVLIGGAVAVAVRLARGRGALVLGGVLLAVTPVVVDLTGAVNPAGPEIAAAIAVWTSLIAIFLARDDSKWTLALFGVAGGTLAVLRELGIGWFFWLRPRLAHRGEASAHPAETATIATRDTGLRAWLSSGLLFLVGAALLTQLVANLPALGASSRLDAHPATATAFVQAATLARIPLLLVGPVTALLLPRLTAAGAVGDLRAVRATVRTGSLAMLVLGSAAGAGLGALGPWVLKSFFHATGISAPALVLKAKLMRWAAWVLIPAQGIALWITMIRFQHAFTSRHPNLFFLFGQTSSVNPFSGQWTPPGAAVPAVVLGVAGIVVLLTFVLGATGSGPTSDVDSVTIRERFIRIS
ncbi:MAG: hypothetical protein AUG49_01420 [Catenulispora sp. 13_1_20CM_3_70_7]|nr:MAG: hypothetical protein AUG49_01420 [Catenulispora sp. 13_1_20CM_3_70_7]